LFALLRNETKKSEATHRGVSTVSVIGSGSRI